MTDNTPCYGFRWSREFNGCDCPVGVRRTIATGTTFAVNGGAATPDLGPGDPVTALAGGGVDLCDGTEGAGGTLVPWGIVVSCEPYYNATTGLMTPSATIPSAVSWGTTEAHRTWVNVVPVTAGLWEIDVDDIVTATTYAAYIALIESNCDHILTGTTGQTRVYPKLDINTTNTTDTLMWRIVGISRSCLNKDFSEDNVKLIVRANRAQAPEFNVTASGGTGL